MRDIIETFVVLFISSVFITLFLIISKISSERQKVIKDIFSETGERFEIFLNSECVFTDQEILISTEQKNYKCGDGKIERIDEKH